MPWIKDRNPQLDIPKATSIIIEYLFKMRTYNTDIEHKGSIYHIQTQDMGPQANYVESIIYKSGKVLASRKTFYTSFLNNPDIKNKIVQILEKQHNEILAEVSTGKFDGF